MNTKDIPIAKVLEQSQRYTNRQMKYLYEDVKMNPMVARGIKNLYEKAERLHDDLVMEIIENKYDMFALYDKDLSGLPEVNEETTRKHFDEIYEMIKKINPYDDQVIILQRENSIKRSRGGIRNRRHGSNAFMCCFKKVRGQWYFGIKSYLFKTSTDVVRKLAEVLNCEPSLKTKVVPEIIDWCVRQNGVEKELLKILRTFPDDYPIPLEDIVDMENGEIRMYRGLVCDIH